MSCAAITILWVSAGEKCKYQLKRRLAILITKYSCSSLIAFKKAPHREKNPAYGVADHDDDKYPQFFAMKGVLDHLSGRRS
jgi:hypothetical protein